MNVITVKLRHPAIPKTPRAAKIILGGPKPCGRCGVSYCCHVTQSSESRRDRGASTRARLALPALCSCPLLSGEKSPPPHEQFWPIFLTQ